MEEIQELDYYKMRLRKYLYSSFPELLGEHEFIQDRADSAADAYEGAFFAGIPIEVCKYEAHQVLFKGLYFSKFSSIFEVLTEEFSRQLSDDQFRPFAIQMLPVCEPVFAEYELDDDFAYSPEYNRLYTKLTGTISLWIEKNGLPK